MVEQDTTAKLPLAEGNVATGRTMAILLLAAFFLSVRSPEGTEPNAMIYLSYLGVAQLAVGLRVVRIGLVRGSWRIEERLQSVRRDR